MTKPALSATLLVAALLALSGCTAMGKFIDKFDAPPEMTSPCAGADGSPCGPKHYPEQQWMLGTLPPVRG